MNRCTQKDVVQLAEMVYTLRNIYKSMQNADLGQYIQRYRYLLEAPKDQNPEFWEVMQHQEVKEAHNIAVGIQQLQTVLKKIQ